MIKISALLLIILTGFIIVALPDPGKRIFSISKDHGPSLQDASGIFLILFGYAWILLMSLKRRGRISKYQHHPFFSASLLLLGLGAGLLIASVFNDYKSWWIYGATLLAAIQVIFFYLTLK